MTFEVKQSVDYIKKNYQQKRIERHKYRGKIPKKKRIRNKKMKQKALEEQKWIRLLDEFHLIGQ